MWPAPCPRPGSTTTGGTGGSRNGCKVGTLGGGDVFTTRGQLRVHSGSWEDNVEADYTDDRSQAPAETLLRGSNGVSFADNTLLPDGSGPARPPNTPNGLGVFIGSAWGQYYGLASPLVPGAFPATLQNPLSPQAAALLAALNPQDPYVSYAIFGNPGGGNALQQFQNPNISTVKSWGVSNNLDIDLSRNLDLLSITAYRRYTGEFGQSDFALPAREAYNEVAHHQFTQEVRLNGSALDERLHYTLGGFYLEHLQRQLGPGADRRLLDLRRPGGDDPVPARHVRRRQVDGEEHLGLRPRRLRLQRHLLDRRRPALHAREEDLFVLPAERGPAAQPAEPVARQDDRAVEPARLAERPGHPATCCSTPLIRPASPPAATIRGRSFPGDVNLTFGPGTRHGL